MIPEGWQPLPIGRVAAQEQNSFVLGPFGSDLTVSDYKEVGVPVVFVRDVKPNAFRWKSNVFVSAEKAEALRAHQVVPGDIVITKMGLPPGVAAVYPSGLLDGVVTADIIRLRPDRRVVDARFISEVLNSAPFGEQVGRITGGQTRPKLTLRDYKTLTLLLPPLPEQRKIAAILSSVDDAIEATQAVIDQLQVVKKAMMAELLTRGLPGRHTRFKMTEIGEIPEEWEVVPLDSCIEAGRPICYGILMPGKGHPGGVPVIKVKDIKDGAIDTTNLLLTSPAIDAQYARSRVRNNDVLLTIRGSTGRVARVPLSLNDANITQDTARLSIKNGIESSYVYFALQSENAQKQIQSETRGQAVKGINIGDVRKLLVPLPGVEEQRAVVRFFDTCRDVDASNLRELSALRSAKAALLSVLLTGEVRVTPDEVTP